MKFAEIVAIGLLSILHIILFHFVNVLGDGPKNIVADLLGEAEYGKKNHKNMYGLPINSTHCVTKRLPVKEIVVFPWIFLESAEF